MKYDLPGCWDILTEPQTKYRWKSLVNKQVNSYWTERIKSRASLYSSFRYLALESYYPGKTHCVLQHTGIARDVPCISTKLKLLTRSYILLVNRAMFNQNQVDPTCMLCQQAPETVDHFLVECSVLEEKRRPIIDSIFSLVNGLFEPALASEELVQILLDCSKLVGCQSDRSVLATMKNLEKLSKRLCYILHTECYKQLKVIPKILKKTSSKGYPRTQKHE